MCPIFSPVCMEFACSPHGSVGFLQILKILPMSKDMHRRCEWDYDWVVCLFVLALLLAKWLLGKDPFKPGLIVFQCIYTLQEHVFPTEITKIHQQKTFVWKCKVHHWKQDSNNENKSTLLMNVSQQYRLHLHLASGGWNHILLQSGRLDCMPFAMCPAHIFTLH